ncbi:MAG TPA: hypothetical protein P5207_05350, partial [Candidatus Sabulitectum sp.]|nr:hypothetical protein [Candidatus Sabulitectum sp.]
VSDWFWQGVPVDGSFPGRPSPVAVEENGVPSARLTGENLIDFLGNERELLKEEVKLQRELGADLIVTDIDPLPVRAAEVNRLPALAMGNFTWDWILRRMCPDLAEEAGRVSRMYRWGTYLKLPMGPDHSPFRRKKDIPLLRGGPEGDPERVTGLFPNTGIRCLVAFRHLPEGFPAIPPEGIEPFTSLPEPAAEGWLNINHGILEQKGACFADLFAAADVVIAKPGYGIVSQILAAGKPAVLISNGAFPEERYLLGALRGRQGTAVLTPDGENAPFGTAASVLREGPLEPFPASGLGVLAEMIRRELCKTASFF